MRHRSEQKEWHSTPITLLDSATFVSGQTLVLMLRYFFGVRGLVPALPCFHWTFVG